MTVDNGFENQWWNQGQRDSVTEEAALPQDPQPSSRNSLGWAVASNASTRHDRSSQDRLSIATTDVVSPLPSFVSPDSAGPPLTRSLSTRSDELFIDRWRETLPA